MSDDLVKRLRMYEAAAGWGTVDGEAADRIEELEARLAVITERSNEIERANEELGAKLAKAVEALDLIAYVTIEEKLTHDKLTARAILAELKGE